MATPAGASDLDGALADGRQMHRREA